MYIFTLEHSKIACRVDLTLYCITVAALAAFLLVACPREQRVEIASFALAGLVSWIAIEYALHRRVLHGLQPFRLWHEEHHRRPIAIIFTSTIWSAMLIAALVFLPAQLMGGLWRGSALTLGVLTGYLAYTVTHHAVHHWRAENTRLRKRKRWHAPHHYRIEQSGFYGVISAFLDHVLGSIRRASASKVVDKDCDVY
jgi:sterol desaturase/sphingolipid hydroxylase (fatty acid hydroxylase superfamily)